MMGGFGAMGLFGDWWMILSVVAGLAVLVLLAWVAFGLTTTRHEQRPTENSALDILKKRYAAGEISQAEYEIAKRDLA